MTGFLINTTDVTTYDAIGSYVYGFMSITSITEGSTYSGSSINPSSQMRDETSQTADTYPPNNSYITRGSATLTGTWRAMGRSAYATTVARSRQTAFVRIS